MLKPRKCIRSHRWSDYYKKNEDLEESKTHNSYTLENDPTKTTETWEEG